MKKNMYKITVNLIIVIFCFISFSPVAFAIDCNSGSCFCKENSVDCKLFRNPRGDYTVSAPLDKCGCDNNYYSNNIGTYHYSACTDERVLNVFRIVGNIIFISKIIVPLLIIIFGIIELSKAVLASDDKAISKATSLLIKKTIAGVVIFFIPTIVDVVYSFIVEAGEIQSRFYKCQKCLVDPQGNECTDGIGNNDAS